MVTEALVERRIDEGSERVIKGGEKMIRLLKSNDFDVTAACMIRRSESGIWYLHIVSKIVEEKGLFDSYLELIRLTGSDFPPTNSEFEVTLMNENTPLARKIQEWVRDRPGRLFALSDPSEYVLTDVDEVYPYSQDSWERLAVMVTYRRDGETNRWTAKPKIQGLHKNLKPKGAVAYTSTARREGEAGENETRASVLVLVEIDPQLDRTQTLDNPVIQKMLADQALPMADEFFRYRHPDAEIEHERDQATDLSPECSPVGAT